jgi:uncharacterized protein (TIGR02328 family)
MRLWHQALIPKLPRAQLLGQHREICALRGNGWGKKHSTVDYVFIHPMEYLIAYHSLVMNEMIRRGYNVDKIWFDAAYRGKTCQLHDIIDFELICIIVRKNPIYPEHNDEYLWECIENLKKKGVEIE